MPAKLEQEAIKIDTRYYRADVEFLRPYLADRNSTVTEIARDLFHRYANEKRRQLGIAPVAPYPPGALP
jgi:hypothetical protein